MIFISSHKSSTVGELLSTFPPGTLFVIRGENGNQLHLLISWDVRDENPNNWFVTSVNNDMIYTFNWTKHNMILFDQTWWDAVALGRRIL